MNVREYLGLDNAYSYMLSGYRENFDGPYVVDKVLRETPVIPDCSFIKNTTDGLKYICDYFVPLNNYNNRAYLVLTESEYNEYIFIRNNAFYTPYGMMVLLRQGSISCTNSFMLVNDSLIPKNRKIETVDTDKYQIKRSNGYLATFFADYVMENIIMRPLNITLRSGGVNYNTRSYCPVLMKRVKLNPNIPVYDVQFADLMLFDNMISYDMYMLALSGYINGHTPDASKLNFRFNPTERVFKCGTKEFVRVKEN